MEQEGKKLLLIELFARLPYGVKVCIKLPNHQKKIFEEQIGDLIELTRQGGYLVKSKGIDYRSFNLDIKPYLRPMTSMTEEEYKEYKVIDDRSYSCPIDYAHIPASDRIDWLNKNHFDYRGLIEKGLALEAPKGMYNS